MFRFPTYQFRNPFCWRPNTLLLTITLLPVHRPTFCAYNHSDLFCKRRRASVPRTIRTYGRENCTPDQISAVYLRTPALFPLQSQARIRYIPPRRLDASCPGSPTGRTSKETDDPFPWVSGAEDMTACRGCSRFRTSSWSFGRNQSPAWPIVMDRAMTNYYRRMYVIETIAAILLSPVDESATHRVSHVHFLCLPLFEARSHCYP